LAQRDKGLTFFLSGLIYCYTCWSLVTLTLDLVSLASWNSENHRWNVCAWRRSTGHSWMIYCCSWHWIPLRRYSYCYSFHCLLRVMIRCWNLMSVNSDSWIFHHFLSFHCASLKCKRKTLRRRGGLERKRKAH
jgi:hypothetical protein